MARVAFAVHLFGAAILGERGLLPVGLALHVGYVATATVVFRGRGLIAATVTALTLWARSPDSRSPPASDGDSSPRAPAGEPFSAC